MITINTTTTTTMNTTMNRRLTIFKLKRKRCSTIADSRDSGLGTSYFTAAADTATVTTSTAATASTNFTCTTATATNSTSISVLDHQVADRVREEKKVMKRRGDIHVYTGAGTDTMLESEELGPGGSSEARPSKRLRLHSRNRSQSTHDNQVDVNSDILNTNTIGTSRRGDTDTLDLSATSEKTLVDVGQDESHGGETRANGSGWTSKSGVFLSSSRFSKTSLICGYTCTTHENFDDSTSHGLDIIDTLKKRLYGSCAQLVASRAREREVQKRLEVQEWKFGLMKKRYEKVRKDNELLMKRVEELKKLEGNRKRRMEEVIEEEQEKLVVEILLEVD